jgi:hypothetical protein
VAESGKTLGSRENPAPLGATVKTRIERGDRYSAPEVYNLEITLVEVVTGKEARDRIEGQNVAGQPRAGFEYVLCRLKVGYFSKARGFAHSRERFEVLPEHFAAVATNGAAEFERPVLSRQPDHGLIGTSLAVNESREGWIVLEVAEGGKASLIFRREYEANQYGVWGAVWFQLA